MKARFTFDEMIYNNVCQGKQIYYFDDETGQEELKTIDYVKLEKDTRQVIVHCTDGSVFGCGQDKLHDFQVNNRKEWKSTNMKKLKGRK
jgi:hypothetical protein